MRNCRAQYLSKKTGTDTCPQTRLLYTVQCALYTLYHRSAQFLLRESHPLETELYSVRDQYTYAVPLHRGVITHGQNLYFIAGHYFFLLKSTLLHLLSSVSVMLARKDIYFNLYNFFQHCFICHPSDSSVSGELGLKPGLLRLWRCQPESEALDFMHKLGSISSTTLAINLIHNSTRSHPQLGKISSTTRLDLFHNSGYKSHPQLD